MTDFYISPTGSGNKSGSSADNASTISGINALVSRADGGDRIVMISDQGSYNITRSINLYSGGDDGAPITIVGMSSTGQEMAATLVGTRADVYSPTAASGTEVFRLMVGAANLTFENLKFEDVSTAFRLAAISENITIQDVSANNVSRLIDNLASLSPTASVSGLTVRNVEVEGFSKGVIRLQYDTNNVLIENVKGDSQHIDGANFAIGVHLDGTVHDVVIRNTEMGNITDTTSSYRNGDGFATERGVYDILFENTRAYNNTDAGYDLKSTETQLLNAISDGNARNFRFWAKDTVAENIQGLNPNYHGGSSTCPSNVWVAANGHVVIKDSTFLDDDGLGFVFDLQENGATAIIDGVVSNQTTTGSAIWQTPVILAKTAQLLGTIGVYAESTLSKAAEMSVRAATIATSEVAPSGISGTNANDVIVGTSGADVITDDKGADILSGGGGNDYVVGGAGIDVINGDDGNDILIGGYAVANSAFSFTADRLYGGDGSDVIYGDAMSMQDSMGGADTIEGGAGNDVIYGDSDILAGTARGGNDKLKGGTGDDVIYGDGRILGTEGRGGNDTITGGLGNDHLIGGLGNDVFSYDGDSFGNDVIYDFGQTTGNRDLIDVSRLGVSFSQLAIAYSGGNTVVGFPTGDSLTLKGVTSLTQNDFRGLTGDKVVLASSLANNGTAGNDTLYGSANIDVILGNGGNDVIEGGGKIDKLYGGDGNDTLIGGFADGTGSITFTADELYGGNNDDRLYGDAVTMSGSRGGNDILRGDMGNDTLYGDAETLSNGARGGNDILSGGAGSDWLYGDSRTATAGTTGGNDRLTGGAGNDHLVGGDGNDVFAYGGEGFGSDVIYDFGQVSGNDDRIDLSSMGLDFNDLSISYSADGALIRLDTGDSLMLKNTTHLTSSDFIS